MKPKSRKRNREVGEVNSSGDDGPAQRKHRRVRQKRTTHDEESSDEEPPVDYSTGYESVDVDRSEDGGEVPSNVSDEDYAKGKQGKPKPKRRTQKQKPKSAKRVERSSSPENVDSDDSEDDGSDDEDESVSIPDQKSNYQPEIVYNRHWTKSDERRLRKKWSADDQFLVDKSSANEVALWRKATALFKQAPPDLLDYHIEVSKKDAGPLKNPATGKQWSKNPNWSPDFCGTMSMIICLPYFRNRVEFLQFVLRYALVTRLDDDARSPGHAYNVHLTFDPLFERVLEKADEEMDTPLDEDQKIQLKSILLEEISDKDPEHWKFHKFLDRVVKKKQNVSKDDESCKLMLCDLKNIVGAWTAYVEAKKLLLPTMAQYRDMVIKIYPNQGFKAGAGGHTQARRDEFASWKKEWMLKVRRRDHVWAREQAEAKAGLARRRAKTAASRDDQPAAEDELGSGGDDVNLDDIATPPRHSGESDTVMMVEDHESLPPDARATMSLEADRAQDPQPSSTGTSRVPETQVSPREAPVSLAGPNNEPSQPSATGSGLSRASTNLPTTLEPSANVIGTVQSTAPIDRLKEYNASRAKVSAQLGLPDGGAPIRVLREPSIQRRSPKAAERDNGALVSTSQD